MSTNHDLIENMECQYWVSDLIFNEYECGYLAKIRHLAAFRSIRFTRDSCCPFCNKFKNKVCFPFNVRGIVFHVGNAAISLKTILWIWICYQPFLFHFICFLYCSILYSESVFDFIIDSV